MSLENFGKTNIAISRAALLLRLEQFPPWDKTEFKTHKKTTSVTPLENNFLIIANLRRTQWG